jgi:hypothetical protein
MGSSKTNNRSLYIDTEALTIKERPLNKVQKATLSLGRLTTRHLVPRLHCNLVACQQSAHVASYIKKGVHHV